MKQKAAVRIVEPWPYEAQFRALMEASPSIVHFKDTEGRYVAVNSAFETMLGLPREEILGKTVWELPLIDEAFVHRMVALDEEVLRTGETVKIRSQPPVASWKDTVTHLVKFPVIGSNGEVEGIGTIETDVTEQDRTLEELRETSHRLELAQRQAKVGYWRWSFAENRLTHWSEEAARISRYPLEAGDKNYDEMLAAIHPDDRDSAEAEFTAADAERRDFSIEYRVAHPDGQITHIREVGEVEYDENGEPIGHVGFVQDITELKEAESRLREFSERLALAQRQAKVGYWRWSFSNRKLSYWSDEAIEICQFQYNREVDYDDMMASVHPDDRERILSEYERFDEARCDYATEYRVIRKDGRITHVREIAEVEYDERGQALGHVGIVQDITELKKAEETAERLLAAVENLTESVALYDRDDRLVFANKLFWEQNAAVRDIVSLGDRYEDILKAMIARGLQPEAEGREAEWLETRLAQHRNPTTPVEIRRQDGLIIQLLEQRLPDGGIATLATDVSRYKKIEADLLAAKEEAEVANRAKTEFLANMSHELRTPLNSIIGFSQILADETFGPLGSSKYLEYARDIRGSGRHLLALISDILDISKIEARQVEIDAEELGVGQVIRECHRMVAERAHSSHVALTAEVAEDLPRLHADRRLVMQILLNLLSNAIKFTPDGGQVLIRGRTDAQGGIVFDVVDTGIGIARPDIPRVIQPFVQVGKADPLHSQGGTGLGLSLVHSLTALHGGRFTIRSKRGLGSKMIVAFPPERSLQH